MTDSRCEYGLLVDYEFCTGCHACQVACAQEYRWPPGKGGIAVMELVENLPNDRHYLKYVPVPTESCVLCKGRTSKGEEPACVSTCMASCMRYGRIEELAEQMRRKPRQVLWVPRASETRSLVPEFR